MIVAEDAYDVTETTIDSHIVKMKSLNADVFVNIATPKFAAQAIRKAAEIGWKPMHFLNNVSNSVSRVMKPNTSATDFAPLSQLQLARLKGETWERFCDIVNADVVE